MTKLAMSKNNGPLPRDNKLVMAQVGWLGQTGEIYAMDDPPYDPREPGGFTPLYIPIGVWEYLGDGRWGIKD